MSIATLRTGFLIVALGAVGQVHAQAGIGLVQDANPTGTIGSNKSDTGSGPLVCPAGTVLRGAYHRDKAMTGVINSVRGMTVRVGLYCGGITTDGTTVNVANRNPNGTPDVQSGVYSNAGTERTDYCPANQLAHQFGGWDREWSGGQYPPWVSSLKLYCSSLNLTATGSWVRLATTAATQVEVGVRETAGGQPAHVERGPFCSLSNASQTVSGLYMQAGGEGYDGINVYCGTLRQARHSAILTFTDFAWSQTLGGSGWLVNLNRNGTLLDNGAGSTGSNRTPHASAAANTATVQTASEIYVLPNNGYQATVSQRPTGIAANTYVTSGTCVAGTTLANEQDASCTLAVNGLPDIAVSMTMPTPVYTTYGQLQNMVLTATNLGPGATDGDDGFTLVATLPSGWTAGAMPANCSANAANTTVTCALNPTPLAAAASPGANGGSVSFTIPVRVNSPTANGTYTANLALNTSVPDGDADPTNNDFNTANNTASGPLVFRLAVARLTLAKISQGGVGAFSFSGDNGVASQTLTTTTAGTAVTGAAQTLTTVGAVTTVTEAATANYALASIVCTGLASGGTATPDLANRRITLDAAATADGADITCTFTNRNTSVGLTISKSDSAINYTPGGSATYVLQACNPNGPAAAMGASISDPLPRGVALTAPWTCTGAGGGTCPASGGAIGGTAVNLNVDLPVGACVSVSVPVRLSADPASY